MGRLRSFAGWSFVVTLVVVVDVDKEEKNEEQYRAECYPVS